jgi:hypothetical protein
VSAITRYSQASRRECPAEPGNAWRPTLKRLSAVAVLTGAVDAGQGCKETWPGSDPGMTCEVYVSAPPASSMTGVAGQRAQEKVPGEHAREVMLDPGA